LLVVIIIAGCILAYIML